jgi:hypothetical protein
MESEEGSRFGFPRFLVQADFVTHRFDDVRSLNKFLSIVYAKAPLVFRNIGKGVTINFDESQ